MLADARRLSGRAEGRLLDAESDRALAPRSSGQRLASPPGERELEAEHESPLVESHLAKYRSLMPALALPFHLVHVADGAPPGPVSLGTAALAAAMCDQLEAHARRVYVAADEGDAEPARRLSERLDKGELPSRFTVRQVVQHAWFDLARSDTRSGP